jgi:flagellar hook-associated protein 2
VTTPVGSSTTSTTPTSPTASGYTAPGVRSPSTYGLTQTSLGGLASSLNTAAIINALMTAASQPQQLLEKQVTTENSMVSSYQSLINGFNSVLADAQTVATPATWQAVSSTSSSSAVTATASTGAQVGSLTFDVTQLASAMSEVSSSFVSSLNSTISSTGSLTITQNGTSTTVTPGDGSLGSVVTAINKANAGIQAAAVQVAPGQYRLQLSSTSTGAASAFTISGIDGMGGFSQTSVAQDAQLTVGAGSPGQYTVDSASNTVTSMLPGVSLQLNALATGVTVSTAANPTYISTQIQTMVTSLNATLSAIGSATAYDNTGAGNNGPLLGDATAQGLGQQVLGLIAAGASGGQSLASAGLTVNVDGSLSFDPKAFATAYAANPQAVANLFLPAGTFSPTSSTIPAGAITEHMVQPSTLAGTYAVSITQAASQASATVDASAGLSAGQTITLSYGTTSATYTVSATDTLATVSSALAALAQEDNIPVTTTATSSGLQVLSTGYGSEETFGISATGGLNASTVTPGTDVAGTINGFPASGIGQLLTAPAADPKAGGLTLTVGVTSAQLAAAGGNVTGNFTYTPGVAASLETLANSATDPVNGSLTLAVNNSRSEITTLNAQIQADQNLLNMQEQYYQSQFATMETSLSNLKSEQSYLTAQLASLTGSSTSSSSSSSGG